MLVSPRKSCVYNDFTFSRQRKNLKSPRILQIRTRHISVSGDAIGTGSGWWWLLKSCYLPEGYLRDLRGHLAFAQM